MTGGRPCRWGSAQGSRRRPVLSYHYHIFPQAHDLPVTKPRTTQFDTLALHAGEVSTIDSLAEQIQHLDLVISIDSMPAHLAGALGRPVWTLLPRDADWRWMEARHNFKRLSKLSEVEYGAAAVHR